jgi:hypothetical protein
MSTALGSFTRRRSRVKEPQSNGPLTASYPIRGPFRVHTQKNEWQYRVP